MMRKPVATRTTAAAAGLLLGLCLPALEFWQGTAGLSDEARRVLFTLALFVLFLGPVLLFVVGVDHIAAGSRSLSVAQRRASLKAVAVRALCWLVGVGLGFGALWAARLP